MASATMQAIINKRKLRVEAAEKANAQIDEQAIEQIDEQAVDEQPEPDIKDDATQPEQPELSDTDKQPKETPDFKRKFERLKGKTSGMEKALNAAEAQAKTLRERLERLEARQLVQDELAARGSEANVDDTVERTVDEGGDFGWFSGDESPSEQPSKPKATKADKSDKAPADVRDEIKQVLAEREQAQKQQSFVDKMDGVLSELGDKSSFIELINEPDFDAFVSNSRQRLALFNSASSHQDDEAVAMMRQIVGEYLGKDKTKATLTSPTVKKQNKAMPKSKGEQINYEQYLQAVKDKRFASRRAAANKIIAAYNKQ